MNSRTKQLGIVVCALGLASARLPSRVVQHGMFHDFVEAHHQHHTNEALAEPFQPTNAAVLGAMADDDDRDARDEWNPSNLGVCYNDFKKFCAPDAVQNDYYEEQGGFGRFYTATTHVIFNAARRLTGHSHDRRQFREHRDFHKFVVDNSHAEPGEGMAHREAQTSSVQVTNGPPAEKATNTETAEPRNIRLNGKRHERAERHDHHDRHDHDHHHHHHQSISHMHRSNHHNEHHGRRRLHMHPHDFTGAEPVPNPFGYNPQVEMCLRTNMPNLNSDCREAIESFDEQESDYEPNYAHMLTHVWLSAIFWVALSACLCKKARTRKQKYTQISAVMKTLHTYPDLKMAVESAAGVEVPEIRKVRNCCFFIAPALITAWATIISIAAVCVTAQYFAEEDPEGGEKLGWGMLALAGLLITALIFALIRTLHRAGHFQRQHTWNYSYNGPNNGYIALTGSGVPSAPPSVDNAQQICTGIPVSAPNTVSAGAHTYNAVNVL